ncbi:MAG: DUF4397 domain-containing protein [Myxococcota bacterium]
MTLCSSRRVAGTTRATLATLASFTLSFALAGAAGAADVYVVHGIDGTDLGLDQALAVDIEVDGSCDLSAVEFGDVAGAVAIETGEVEIDVYLSDGTCGSTQAISGTFDLAIGETAILVAHLDQNGTPTLSKFTADTTALAEGRFRISVAHAAAAPGVIVKLQNQDKKKQRATTEAIRNGQQSFAAVLKEGTYKAKISAAAGGANVATLKDVPLAGNLVFVAVGSLAGDTLDVIPVEIGAGPI